MYNSRSLVLTELYMQTFARLRFLFLKLSVYV